MFYSENLRLFIIHHEIKFKLIEQIKELNIDSHLGNNSQIFDEFLSQLANSRELKSLVEFLNNTEKT